MFNIDDAKELLDKWQEVLRLRDWDLRIELVEKEWRKSGDVKIDCSNKVAIVLINNHNPKVTNLEALVIHELLHIKLWGMDQMIEGLIYNVFGSDESDPKFSFAYAQFMKVLETTTEDLTKGFLAVGAKNKEVPFGYVEKQVEEEINK